MKDRDIQPAIKNYIFRTDPEPEAIILLIHGLGEHAGRYGEWAARFNESGVEIRSFDLPGHGLSAGTKGVVPPYEKLFDIIDSQYSEICHEKPGIPVFIYGHSLGGSIVLDYLIKRKQSFAGAIVTSPWIKLTVAPPKIKSTAARIFGHLFPDLTSSSGLNPAHLSHEKSVFDAYVNDPLVHDRISLRLFIEAEKAADEILKNAAEIKLPLLIIHGRDDQITSPAGSVEVASSAPAAILKLWDDCYHELHNEQVKEDHFTLIREWMETLI